MEGQSTKKRFQNGLVLGLHIFWKQRAVLSGPKILQESWPSRFKNFQIHRLFGANPFNETVVKITSRSQQFLNPPSWAGRSRLGFTLVRHEPQVLVAPWRNCMWRCVVWEQEERRRMFLGHFLWWPRLIPCRLVFFSPIFGGLVWGNPPNNGPTIQVKDLYWCIINCPEIWWILGIYK